MWENGEKTQKTKKEISILSFGVRSFPFHSVRSKWSGLPKNCLCSVLVSTAKSGVLSSSHSVLEGEEAENPPLAQPCLKCWFHCLVCTPQFTVQSPHVTASCSWPVFYSYLQWERQGGVCLLHVSWNQKSLIIQLGRICSLLVLLFIQQPRQLLYLFSGSRRKWRKQIPKTSGPGGHEIWVLIRVLVWGSHVILDKLISLDHCVKCECCSIVCPAYALHVRPGSLWW